MSRLMKKIAKIRGCTVYQTEGLEQNFYTFAKAGYFCGELFDTIKECMDAIVLSNAIRRDFKVKESEVKA